MTTAAGRSSRPRPRTSGSAAKPVHALVDRFYDLMDLEPAYRDLRASHGTTLDEARDKLAWFLTGWLGGPSIYIERFGHPRLARATCRSRSASTSATSGWPACTRR